MEPYFSIILPTYNRAGHISNAIESGLQQTCTSWELLIIDDGSTDATEEVVKGFSDERIKYHWQENAERSVARNKGIELARGKYICFLDSDDYLLPNHLAILRRTIEKKGYSKVLFFVQTMMDEGGNIRKVKPPVYDGLSDQDLVLCNSIGVPRWCGHRDIFKKFKFDPAYHIGEDKELLMRIVQAFPIIAINEWTTVYTEHPDRTVNAKGDQNAKSHLTLISELCQSSQGISRGAKKMALANAWYNLGRHYAQVGQRGKAIQAFFRSSTYLPSYKLKRKVALLLGRS